MAYVTKRMHLTVGYSGISTGDRRVHVDCGGKVVSSPDVVEPLLFGARRSAKPRESVLEPSVDPAI